MNSFLKDLKKQGGDYANIGTSFANLNEEARVYIRYASLITQFLNNFGEFVKNDLGKIEFKLNVDDFYRTLNSVTGRLGLLKETFSDLTTALGTGFAKVASLIAGYLIPVIRYLTAQVENFFAWLTKITGINFNIKLGIDVNTLDSTEGIEKTKEETDDLNKELEDVEKNAKKAKAGLQSFDRVNNITSSKDSKSDGSDDFDYSILANDMKKLLDPVDEAYANFIDELSKRNQEYTEKLKQGFYKIVDELKKKASELTGRVDFDLGFDFSKIKQSLMHIKENILSLIKTWGTFFIEIGLKIADDINIGAIITSFLGLTDAVTGLADAFSKWLTPVLSELYDKYFAPLVGSLGDAIISKLDKWTTKIRYTTALIKTLTEQPLTLDELDLINSSETFYKDLEDMQTKLDDFRNKLEDIFKKISDAIRYLTEDMSPDEVIAIDEDESGWGVFLRTLDAVKYIIGEIGTGLKYWAQNDALPWLSEKLKDVGNFISEHREDIVSLLEKIAGFAWDSFKTFVELVGKLIGFVIENPGAVTAFFAGLLGLKVASWFADVATKIGLTVTAMSGLKSLASGGLAGLLGGGAGAAAGGAGAAAGGAGAAAGAGFSAMLGPIAAVIAAVAVLTAIIVDLWNTSDSFKESVGNAWEYIKNAFDSAKEAIAPAIENLKEAFSTFYESYESSGLKDILSEILSFVVEVLGDKLSIAITLIGEAIGIVINLLGDIFVVLEGVIDFIAGFVEMVVGLFTGDLDTIKEGWGKLATGLVEIISGLLQVITDMILGIADAIFEIGENIFGGLFEGMSTSWKEGIASVKEWLNSWIDSVKEFFGIHSPSTLFASFGENIVQGLINGISNLWSTLISSVRTLCTNFISVVKTILTNVGDVGSTLVNSIKNGITGAWSGLTSKVSSLCNTLINSIKNTLSNGWNTVNSWLSNIGNSISNGWNAMTGKSSSYTAKSVTTHAVGGSIAGGQLFIANENGGAELVGNITGASGAQVANNGMIIEAMTDGVFTGVYNALAEVANQRGSVNNNNTSTKLEINGFGLIDSSTLNELARMLAPYLSSNNSNIANVNFSI